MKKFLSLIIVLTLLSQGCLFGIFSSLAAGGIEIKEMVVDDFELREGIDSFLCPEEEYDPETGEWRYVGEYEAYAIDPPSMTVVYEEYAEEKTVSGSVWDIADAIGDFASYDCGQCFASPLVPGNTYECYLTLCGFETTYNVTIVPTPVSRVEVVSSPSYFEKSNGEISFRWDSEIGDYDFSKPYFCYFIELPEITVYYKDGREPDRGDLWDLNDKYDLPTYFVDPQSYETPFGLGMNEVKSRFYGYDFSFYVEIKENPISSVELLSVPEPIIEHTGGSYSYESIYDEENDCWIDSDMYYMYDAFDGDFEIKVNYKDGTYDSGNVYEIAENNDFEVYLYSGQGSDSQWEAGSHDVVYTLCGFEFTVPVEITESPVESITALADYEIIEHTDGFWDTAVDAEGNIISDEGWFYYYVGLPQLEIKFKNGETFTGSEQEAFEKYGYSVEWTTDQSSENPWGIGTHKVQASFMGYPFTFDVRITESPVEKVVVQDVEVYEKLDAGTAYAYMYDEETGEEYWQEYTVYYLEPDTLKVYLKDGSFVSGVTPDNIRGPRGWRCP